MFTKDEDRRLIEVTKYNKLLDFIPTIVEPTDPPFKAHSLPAFLKSRLYQVLLKVQSLIGISCMEQIKGGDRKTNWKAKSRNQISNIC